MKNRQKNEQCSGYYEVSGYTTDDGKKVDGYTRRCWKHGEGTAISNLNEGKNPYPNTVFQQTNPPIDTPIPTADGENSDQNTPNSDSGNTAGDWLGTAFDILTKVATAGGQMYLDYLLNKNNEKTTFSAVNTQTFNNGQIFQNNYQNFPLSTFDAKKTEADIKNSMKNIEGLLKQKEITDNDISVVRTSLKNCLGSICNDIESISYRKSQQPKIPTEESMEIGKTIEQDRKQTVDNAYNLIFTINLAQNALKKNFDSVKMDSSEYNKKLNEYARQLEELKNMSKDTSALFDSVISKKINPSNTINRIRNDIGLKQNNMSTPNYNGTTGGAADIDYKLLIENNIPVKNNETYDEQFILKGNIGKIDLNSKHTQSIIRKIMKFIKNKFLLSIKDNNELSLRDLAVELYLHKNRLTEKDKIDKLLNAYVEKNKVPIELTNDLRHRAGSALMSKYTKDTDISRMWGNLKEIRDLVIGKENDTNIDSRNNAIGRKIYLENKTATDEELIDIVYDGIKNNIDYNVNINETKIPLQEFFYFINNYTYKR